MHRIVLSSMAALTLLALIAGGRGESVAYRQADAARAKCRGLTALGDAARAPEVQMAADARSVTHARRLLVADRGLG